MKIIIALWVVIALALGAMFIASVISNMEDVESAMQASQLYDEAIMYLSALILVTLLLLLAKNPNKKSLAEIEKQLTELNANVVRLNQLGDKIISFVNNQTNEGQGKVPPIEQSNT